MTDLLDEQMSHYRSILNEIEGGHSNAVVYWTTFSDRQPEVISSINGAEVRYPLSSLPWLDFSEEFDSYGNTGTRRRLSTEKVPEGYPGTCPLPGLFKKSLTPHLPKQSHTWKPP